mmetsp:Transcript_22291/g.63988  ORF Transcript_22291/g.63988 Transcript_22291/m.63988 type:complete len:442 (-) Transcript_22291:32-1357(-)
MVHITVNFDCDQQRWTHGFEIEGGRTISDLKRSMLNPPGEQEDIDSFELRLLGRRVPDFEKIEQPLTFDFVYLGPEVGAERAKEDQRSRNDWERRPGGDAVAAEASRRQRLAEEQRRRETAEAAREAEASRSREAARKPLADGEHEVVVTIDRSLGLTASVRVCGGATILDVKEKLAAQDSTGALKVTEFGLAVVGSEGQAEAALPDDTVLCQSHLRLRTIDTPTPAKAFAVAAPPEKFPTPHPATRPKDLPPPPRSSVGDSGWLVVGGVDKGGIIVRSGRATSSPQLPERLSTGAVVEQLAVEGERLNYRKLTGTGPETGWVSLSISGKTLLERRRLTAEDLFTLGRALSMQEDLIRGFANHDFQRALAKLIAEHPSKSGAAFVSKRRELALSVQSEVLPRYGFEGNDSGVSQMMSAFGPRHQCDEVGWNQGQIQMLLQM